MPYGTLLCVSDKPLHGELKLPGQANRFYERAIAEHLKIGIEDVRAAAPRRRQAPQPQAARVQRAAVPVIGGGNEAPDPVILLALPVETEMLHVSY